MSLKQDTAKDIPLYISRSKITTFVNKTGFWRFVRPGYDEKTAPCSQMCPVGQDIARIEMLTSRGMFQAAWETILQENPFPSICGRVCFHMCESACNRSELDQAVAIHNIERFIGDMAIIEGYPVPEPLCQNNNNIKRIAIAGSGPSGLSAAWFLSRLGYKCDIFEAQEEPGGVLRWGIPAYRLPYEILKDEIKRVQDQGVNIYCSHPVTYEFIKKAKNEYDALFIGCGYGQSLKMGIEGESLASDGLEFLQDVRKGENACIQCISGVIGGGNTAIDVARSLIRMGARPTILYRRRQQDMPAFKEEIEMAVNEGVQIMELVSPISIKVENGEYVMTLQKMKTIDMNTPTGRARVVPDGDKTTSFQAAQIFTAIGAEAEKPWYVVPPNQENNLYLSHCTFQNQDMPIIFGGDLTNKVKSVTDAIASGKQAAMALDTYFNQGFDAVEEKLNFCKIGSGPCLSMEIYLQGERKNRNCHVVSFQEINTDYFPKIPCQVPKHFSQAEQIRSFAEIEQTFSNEAALKESERCFNCGLCNDCDNCRLFCPEVAIHLDESRYINFDYCKGCGICVKECPRNAMSLEEEKI